MSYTIASRFGTAALVAALAAPAWAQPPVQPQPPPDFTPAQTKLLARVPGMEQVTVTENVVFKSTDSSKLAMDVYRRPGGGTRPAVVLISGASDVRGWGLYKDYGRLVAASDFVAVVPDKRFQGPQSMEHGAQDTVDLVAHLRQNAARYDIDPNRVCLWTFSAGGSLAQIGLNPANGITCVVAFYGLGQAGPRMALRQHAEAMPPMLIVRAGRDNVQTNNAIDVFASLALALNAPVTVVNYPGGVHGFEVEDFRPEPKQPPNVAQTDRILRLTLAWLRAHTAIPEGAK